MSAIYLLIPISMAVAALFLGAFLWAVRSGQYEDTCTPALRILTDEEIFKPGKEKQPAESTGKSNHER